MKQSSNINKGSSTSTGATQQQRDANNADGEMRREVRKMWWKESNSNSNRSKLQVEKCHDARVPVLRAIFRHFFAAHGGRRKRCFVCNMMHCMALSRALSTRLTPNIGRFVVSSRSFGAVAATTQSRILGVPSNTRLFGTVAESPSATDAWKKSCYMEIDFTISEDDDVIEAIQRLAAYDIGCLVTIDVSGNIVGVVSERDMITKIALKNKRAKDTKISEISTKNPITATPDTPVDECMELMMEHDIRHLPMLNEEGSVVGMLSIKDCAKAVLAEKEECINTLSDFALGRGGTFVVD